MLNQINLIGRLVADPTTAESKSGGTILSFRVANNLTKDVTVFVDCKAFGKTADACAKVLHKGSQVALTGKLSQYTYTTKDNQKRSGYEIICDSIDFLDPKEKDPKQGDVAIDVASE